MSNANGSLEFVVVVPSEPDPTRKGFGVSAERVETRMVPVGKLRDSLNSVVEGLSEALSNLRAVGDFRLTELTIEAEISAEGGVRLLGTGAKVGTKGSVTLTFAQKQ